MMSTPSPRCQPVPIAHWLRWAFVLLIPFCAISFDTWLNTRQINKDYRKAELDARQRQLEQNLNELRANEARLQTMDRIEIEAPEIGLGPPEPHQIRTIYYTQNGAVSASNNRNAPLACIREGTSPSGQVMPAPRLLSLALINKRSRHALRFPRRARRACSG